MTKLAFLDVDTQVDFVEPDGKLYAQGAEAIKPNLARLVRCAREAGLPLVSSVDAHRPDDPEFQQYPPHCIKGTTGQAKLTETLTGDEVYVANAPGQELPDPRAEHVVIEKQQFDVFTSAPTEELLRRTGAEELVVFGVVTEVCVEQAVTGLLERGYRVRLVEDAIWPIDPAAGEEALARMEARGAVRTTTDAVVGELVGSGA